MIDIQSRFNTQKQIDLTKKNLKSQIPVTAAIRLITYDVSDIDGISTRIVNDIAEFYNLDSSPRQLRKVLKYLRNKRDLTHPWPIEVLAEY